MPLDKETPFLGDCLFDEFALAVSPVNDTTIDLELEAAGRARFGRRFRLRFVLR